MPSVVVLVVEHGVSMFTTHQLPGRIVLINVWDSFVIRGMTALRPLAQVTGGVVVESQLDAIHTLLVNQPADGIIAKLVRRAVAVFQP
nr:hypothetical protein PB20LOC_04373 [Pectobacterium parmentieri]